MISVNRSFSLALAVGAIWLSSCQTTTESRRAVIGSAEVTRESDASYRLQWTVEPSGTPVAIFVGTDPANIPRADPVARTSEAEATVSGLDPSQRYYFELVPEGEQGHIVATRFIELEGARNFRDLGGHATADGRRVRWGTVFRSDALNNLTDNDLTRLSNMGIRMVCDLRRDWQLVEDPDRLPRENPPATLYLDIARAADSGTARSANWSEEEADAIMGERYAARIRLTGAFYGTMLDALAKPGHRPFLFHCRGGKDRAGIGAALVLLSLGVPEETVMKDYLLTNLRIQINEEEVQQLAVKYDSKPGVLRRLMYARRSYMQAAFDAMKEDHGSIEVYLREELDLTDEKRDQLRAALLYD